MGKNTQWGGCQLVAVCQKLILVPGFTGVAKNVDEVLPCVWRELERERAHGRTSVSFGWPLCRALRARCVMSFMVSGV